LLLKRQLSLLLEESIDWWYPSFLRKRIGWPLTLVPKVGCRVMKGAQNLELKLTLIIFLSKLYVSSTKLPVFYCMRYFNSIFSLWNFFFIKMFTIKSPTNTESLIKIDEHFCIMWLTLWKFSSLEYSRRDDFLSFFVSYFTRSE
jgi:hypothetical protein